jgi:bifunctional UDP-N-acetylglucosamine pyrophosphorylase/glucosamine-1-phosphate N-acetyltransferase
VREDVPPGALAVSAGSQRTIERWALERRAGTPQAEAAAAALEEDRPGEPADDGSA